MAEVTNELIYEVLKRVQDQLVNLNDGRRDMREELRALRGHPLAMQTDVSNIFTPFSIAWSGGPSASSVGSTSATTLPNRRAAR